MVARVTTALLKLHASGHLSVTFIGQLSSASIGHRRVGWPPPSKVIESRGVPGWAGRPRCGAAYPLSSRAVAVRGLSNLVGAPCCSLLGTFAFLADRELAGGSRNSQYRKGLVSGFQY